MSNEERLSDAKELKTYGWDAGVHPEFGVVIFLHERVWRVAGGRPQRPSLLHVHSARVGDVEWIDKKERAAR